MSERRRTQHMLKEPHLQSRLVKSPTRSAFSSPLLASKMERSVERMKEIQTMFHSNHLSLEDRTMIFGLVNQMDDLLSSKYALVTHESDPAVDMESPSAIFKETKLNRRFQVSEGARSDDHQRSPLLPPVVNGGIAYTPFTINDEDLVSESNHIRFKIPGMIAHLNQYPPQRLFSSRLAKPETIIESSQNCPRKLFRALSNIQGHSLPDIWPRGLIETQTEINNVWKEIAFQAFDKFDVNHDGYLQKAEILKAVNMMKVHNLEFDVAFNANPDAFIEGLVRDIDTDGNGKVDRKEFADMMQKAICPVAGGNFLSSKWQRTHQFARNVFIVQQRKTERNTEGDGCAWLCWGPCQFKAYLIHPLGSFHNIWDLIISLVALVLIFTLPLSMAWAHYETRFYFLNIAAECFFVVDVVKAFFTGYVDESGVIVMDQQMIRRRYLAGDFPLDALASVPFYIAFSIFQIMQFSYALLIVKHMLKGLKIIRSFKLFAVNRTGKFYQLLKVVANSVRVQVPDFVGRLFKVILWTFIISHWIGCIQFMLVRLTDFPEDSWVVLAELDEESPAVQWLWSFYKALAQMISVGFQSPPFTNTSCNSLSQWCQFEHWITLTCLYIGAGMYSYLISSMLWIFQTSSLAGRAYEEKRVHLEVMMQEKNLPLELRDNIREYFNMKYPHRVYCNEVDIFKDMPTCCVRKILYHDAGKVLNGVTLLRENPLFATSLVPFMTRFVLGCDEVIFMEGTQAESMYFIESGSVSLSSRTGVNDDPYDVVLGSNCPQITHKTQFFGEVGCLLNINRTMTVTSKTKCVLFEVSRDDMVRILNGFPVAAQRIALVAQGRFRRFRQATDPTSFSLLPGDENGDPEDISTSGYVDHVDSFRDDI